MRAIFLGSFNPPHSGHVNCIKSVINSGVLNDLNIDKIHIIPCYQNPNKVQVKDPDWNFWQRYKLCTLEFYGLSEFVIIDDIEMLINKTDCNKSYTYNLIKYFKGGHDETIKSDFWWIITIETYKELLDGKWYHSEELLSNNKFIIVYNDSKDLDLIMSSKYYKFDNYKFVELIKTDNSDNHSTQLREMIKNDDENVRKYMKFETWMEIKKSKMYKD